MLQTGEFILKLFFILLQVANSLLVFEADSPLAINLGLQLIDGLLECDFIIEQLLYFPHAVSNDQF
jgi:hypothetical protein